jgi:hypothetical protein
VHCIDYNSARKAQGMLRTRLIELADEDIRRYREIRDSEGKVFLTFLEGASHLYKKAGLGRKAEAVNRLISRMESHV